MQQKLEQLRVICEQLEAVRLEAVALRVRLASEMSETSRRESLQPAVPSQANDNKR